MSDFKFIIVWIMMGMAGLGIATQLPHKPKVTVGLSLFALSGPIILFISSTAYIYELKIWDKCLINCDSTRNAVEYER